MPYPVNIDTIVFAPSRFGGRDKRLVAKFLDPAGVANYYALFVKLNNVIQPDFSSSDDNLRDGDTISMRIPFSDNFTLHPVIQLLSRWKVLIKMCVNIIGFFYN